MWSCVTSFFSNLPELQKETHEIIEVVSEITDKVHSLAVGYIWDMGEILIYKNKLDKATNWKQWSEAAGVLDSLNEKDKWKHREQSNLYDYRFIRRRMKILQSIRETGDIQELVHNLRSGLLRGIGGTLNPTLYEVCLLDTKQLIVDYQSEVCKCLQHVLNSPKYPLKDKVTFFSESRYAYGKTALLLSGGATLGMYHLGVVKVLYEHDLLPKIIAGTSAGSLVAAMVCCTESENLSSIFKKGNLNCDSFSGLERGSWVRKVKRFFREGHLMDIKVFQSFVRENLGDLTFQEAYEKSGLVLNITVGESSTYQDYRLLNYLTAPHVLIWSACVASSAIPYVFPAIELVCKNARGEIVPFYPSGMKFIDGTVKADLPMEKLAELFNVNAFIVSQTNPWVIPLLSEDDGGGIWGDSLRFRLYKMFKRFVLMEFRHRLKQLNVMGLCNSMSTFLGILAQEYRGHVTIWPVPSMIDYLNILTNPTLTDIQRSVKKGMLRTFPKMNMLKNIMLVERQFDKCYQQIRTQLKVDTIKLKVALNSQVEDLNMNSPQLRPGANLMPDLKDLLDQECPLSDDDY